MDSSRLETQGIKLFSLQKNNSFLKTGTKFFEISFDVILITFEGVSNTITQLRLLGNVLLELHYWSDRFKYVLPNILKCEEVFRLNLFLRQGGHLTLF